ncbi:branched-chain amino acid ABC transporter permease [Synergistales bacterium]|nr:branched-chain amino acid ABC transporter permease [Synergistales bacterium]
MDNIIYAVIISVIRGGFYSLMAVGLSLVFGVMNIANFAHGEFYMLGAYFAYCGSVVFRLNPFLSILFAGAAVFVIGVGVEKAVFVPLRVRSKKNWLMNTFLLTLGISIIMQNLVRVVVGNRNYGLRRGYFQGNMQIFGMGISNDRIICFLISMAAIVGLMLFLNRTRLGRAIRAVSQDATGAQLVGINLGFIYSFTFGLSCALAAIAGACLLFKDPATPIVGLAPLYKSWFVLILVGMGNVGASIIGGIIVGFLETLAVDWLGSGWMDVMSLGIIMLMLIIKPNGLFGKKGVKSAVE